jgi:hypothetical protein
MALGRCLTRSAIFRTAIASRLEGWSRCTKLTCTGIQSRH